MDNLIKETTPNLSRKRIQLKEESKSKKNEERKMTTMRKSYVARMTVILLLIIITSITWFIILELLSSRRELDLVRIRRESESRLAKALVENKETLCNIPHLNPFEKEVTQFDKNISKIECKGQDWVRCYLSECKVVSEILKTTKYIVCTYRDILHESDFKYRLGPKTDVKDDQKYILMKSDHVKITCYGRRLGSLLLSKWKGYATGFRTVVDRKPVPPERGNDINILIIGFDSTSKNGFIRSMPKSYQYLSEDLKGIFLNGLNVLGDGTPAALFPLLTGKNELEMPDVRKNMNSNYTLDIMPFLFYLLKDIGYRTAYFEDSPLIGTFQFRFNGFKQQPTDHYLRSFFLESGSSMLWNKMFGDYCVGDTLRYKLMMNLTNQFLQLDGKKFCFTFIADITHDANMLSVADDDMLDLLKTLVKRQVLENTMVLIMGDHGPRYGIIRDTFQGKLEALLPLMAILLPENLKRSRPGVKSVLEGNVNMLTTFHDVHATILDVLNLKRLINPYTVLGANMPRALTLLEAIPRKRSCSEAGIEPHWCACLTWHTVSDSESMYQDAVNAFVNYINSLTEEVRSICRQRVLVETKWVMRKTADKSMLAFAYSEDTDGYRANLNSRFKHEYENYQVKVVVSPGRGVYEASLKYIIKTKKFLINSADISRTNAYGDESKCVRSRLPHLNQYCYCKDYIPKS